MHFNFLDIILLAVAFGFVWGGWWSGFIQSIGGIVGIFLGEILAGRYYATFAHTVSPVFAGNEIVSNVFAFVLIFLLVSKIVGAIFWLVNKMFNIIAIVPGMKFANRVIGAALGFVEASLFIGISLQFLVRLPISTSFADFVHRSMIAGYALALTGWLVPLLPGVIKSAQDATKNLPNINVNDTLKAVNTAQRAANAVEKSGVLNANLTR